MKVSFRQSGGFASVYLGCKFDTEANPGQESSKLENLVKTSDILNLSDRRVKGARDVYLYTFEIEYDGTKHSVTIDELSVPSELEPLLTFLKSESRNLMPDL